MIRHEAVITCLLGAFLGIPVGIGIAAILVGLFAAIFPARRAARLDILRAPQYE